MEKNMQTTTTHVKRVLAGLLMGTALCGQAAPDASPAADTAAVGDLLRRFTDAQTQADAAALRALTAEQYVEISPLGDVDPREKMLGFYVKDPGRTPPVLVIDERSIALLGDTALVTARLNFTMTANGQARSFAMRAGFVAHKDGMQWKMVSAQYTPIRPAKP